MTNEEIDKRRAGIIYDWVSLKHGEGERIAKAVRASDEAAHLGYYDTRTHVALPLALPSNLIVEYYRAAVDKLAAYEEEKP